MNKLLAKVAFEILMKNKNTNKWTEKKGTILIIYIVFTKNFHFIAVTRIQINKRFLIWNVSNYNSLINCYVITK